MSVQGQHTCQPKNLQQTSEVAHEMEPVRCS